MNFAKVLALVLTVALSIGTAFATPPGKSVEYAGGGKGKVVFDGKVHADKGAKCPDCHPKTWPMKKGAAMKTADMNAAKTCGTCHNGKKAFKTSDEADCTKCHKS